MFHNIVLCKSACHCEKICVIMMFTSKFKLEGMCVCVCVCVCALLVECFLQVCVCVCVCALLVECFLQVCVCVCVCRAVHRHFAGQWFKPEKVAQTRKRAPQCDLDRR